MNKDTFLKSLYKIKWSRELYLAILEEEMEYIFEMIDIFDQFESNEDIAKNFDKLIAPYLSKPISESLKEFIKEVEKEIKKFKKILTT
ncbi:hypothetical protein QO179_24025 [Bacillus stercoris]|nr:hypothetical protein [Bacillus stercoris]